MGFAQAVKKKTALELIRTTEEVEVQGESIPVKVEYYRCLACGEEFEDPGSGDDPLDKAYVRDLQI